MQMTVREGISQGKQNITINVNQMEQKPDFEQIQEILQNFLLFESTEKLQTPKQSETNKLRSGKYRKSRR